jgi:hypothetical protein
MLTFQKFTMYGRLGNQMFRVASTIGIAKRNGVPYAFPEWICSRSKRNYGAFFERQLPCLNPSVKMDYKVGEGSFCYKDIDLEKGVTTLSGFFQTERYFEHCKDLVRYHLEPKSSVVENLKEKYGSFLSDSCSVHIRRGDYLIQQNSFPVLDLDYYIKSIKLVESKCKVEKFIVFSDDIDWCKKNLTGNFHFVEGLLDIEDMFLMSMCSHHIIANSSFSWWGAWLGNNPHKVVVAPSIWFGPGLKQHDTSDIIPPSWNKI